MSDTESLDYLQTDFDPSSLTVPRLRSILVAHNVLYPASAKKPQLIEIFTENILPQSRKILAARLRAKRTSRGITDAESSQDSTVDGELMPPPPTPRSRSKKSSARVKQEESESDTPVQSPTKKTPRASSKHPRASDTETGPDGESVRKTIRKSKKNEAPPVKVEEEDQALPQPRIEESPFSYDNPFQSGSSPLTGVRSASGEGRRQTLGSSATKDPNRRKSSSTTRRRTDTPRANDGITPPTSKTFEIEVSKLNGLRKAEDEYLEPSEEFTPEEQMELVRERSQNGQSAVVPRRQPKKQSKGVSTTAPLWVTLIVLLTGYAIWYRREKLAVGYCGVGREGRQLVPSNIQLPDWVAQLAEPQCEPCPSHAYCYEQLVTQCEPDFVLKPHSISLGGILPLPPTCEPDSEKSRKVTQVADKAVEELRQRRAKWECGELVDAEGAPATSVEIEAEELKKDVSKKRRKGMSEAEFEDLWTSALGEIEAKEEVDVSNDGNTPPRNTRRLSSTSLARLPFRCAIRREFRLTLERYRVQVATIILAAMGMWYSNRRWKDHEATKAAVPHLVSLTLERLSNQAGHHIQDKDNFPEPWISIGQLRDDVLRNEHSVSKREALWSRVRKVVENNANVRASQREGRNGEISRVWEWIGAIGAIDSGDVGRRKSGRVSWGAYGDASSPVSGTDAGPEMVQQKWMEGRPIY